jgi:hypothetical protein
MLKEDIEHYESELNLVRYPEFDDAIIGLAERINLGPVFAYSLTKMVEICINDGMDDEMALEHINFNYVGAWLGEGTPIFIDDLE